MTKCPVWVRRWRQEQEANIAESVFRKRINDPPLRSRELQVVLTGPCSKVPHFEFRLEQKLLCLPEAPQLLLQGPGRKEPLLCQEVHKVAQRELQTRLRAVQTQLLPRVLIDRMLGLSSLLGFRAESQPVLRPVLRSLAANQLQAALQAFAKQEFELTALTAASVVGLTVGSLEAGPQYLQEQTYFGQAWALLGQFFDLQQLLELIREHQKVHGVQGVSPSLRARFAVELGLTRYDSELLEKTPALAAGRQWAQSVIQLQVLLPDVRRNRLSQLLCELKAEHNPRKPEQAELCLLLRSHGFPVPLLEGKQKGSA